MLQHHRRFLSVPDDYLASFSLSITNSSNIEFLLEKDVNFIQEYNQTVLQLVHQSIMHDLM